MLLAVAGILQIRAETPKIERENIEWCDVWITHADQDSKPRVLLVGDSITKGYYDQVAAALDGKANCAKFATSACIADPAFLLQLDTILSQYHWDVIHFNNGLHGFTYMESEYRTGYQRAMESIRKQAPHAKLIIALTTPLQSTSGAAELNPRVNERNRIAREMADEYTTQINDLHSISEGHPEFYLDAYHYKPEAIKLQADQVASQIISVMSNEYGISN